ncbi:hypothetical protein ACETRX_35270 [Labrys portucalensis]|uniref:Uncharacterized protein n=1 Tax=Labrys neptuniae TaxID=376174 RepID=A0ABV6ZRT7_9HYPH
MHQDAANCVVAKPPGCIAPTVHAFGEADRVRVSTLEGELGCVLQKQDWTFALIIAAACCREMSIENIAFLDPRV